MSSGGGALRDFLSCLRAGVEVGARRGYVVVVVGLRNRLGECDRFPLGLLLEHTEGTNEAT